MKNNMTGKLNIIMFRFLVGIIIFAGLFYITDNSVYAGNINANEAKVIAVASGTFKYHGKTYRAYSSYINDLYSTLADDDFDLTASQAKSAISYIYENVKEGIDSGYIYEVKDDKKPTTDLDKIEESEKKDDDAANEAVKQVAKESSDKEISDLFEKIDNNQKEKQKYLNNDKASDTDASLYMGDESIVISTDKKTIKLFPDKRIVPSVLTNIIVYTGFAVFVLNTIVFVILSLNHCMKFKSADRKKHRKGHRKRRKIRRVCRIILTITTAVSLTITGFIIAISIGFFNDSRIMQNIQSSGYFRYAYAQYLTEISENTEGDLSILPYDEYIVKEKVSIDSTFKTSQPLDQEEVTDHSIAPYIKRIQLDIKKALVISFVLSLLGMVVAGITNIFMDLRRDRGVRSLFISFAFGVLVSIMAAVFLSVFRIENMFFVEPGYLTTFLREQMDYIIRIFVIIGLFDAVIGISLLGLYKSIRKEN